MKPNFLNNFDPIWVEKTLESLNVEQRIAQLIFAAAYSNRDQKHEAEILELIQKYQIGGLIFFQGNPEKQVDLSNLYQQNSKNPLMLCIDAEWGLAMRLDNTPSFPYQMTLGAISDNFLIYEMGLEIAKQFRRMGLHVNFAPVVDVNNNPNNPVISFRSFGEDKKKVADKAWQYAKGLQDGGILANAKHFPGHGDTATDSHLSLPLIKHSAQRLNEIELYPFKELIEKGLSSIMVAHLEIPALDSTPNLPSTLSQKIITDLLKKELNFQGLVFTDALDMKAISDNFPNGIADKMALKAGNDVLLFVKNVPKAIEEIKKAVENGEILQSQIDESCRKILQAKSSLGLANWTPISSKNLITDLNNDHARKLNQKLAESALTLLKNQNILPIKNPQKLKIASLAIGAKDKSISPHSASNLADLQHHSIEKNNEIDQEIKTVFQKSLEKFCEIDHFFVNANSSFSEIETLKKSLENYDLILAGVHHLAMKPLNNFGILAYHQDIISFLVDTKKAVLVLFSNVYTLKSFEKIENMSALILAYQENEYLQKAASDLIFGEILPKGKLPVNVNEHFALGMFA
ncbi:MAG: glycoside hydrolase family 3 [Bacteroidetes bacterium]|nr:MAG: glycoside hydrolase family 3 [Bacteroidota bacterium]